MVPGWIMYECMRKKDQVVNNYLFSEFDQTTTIYHLPNGADTAAAVPIPDPWVSTRGTSTYVQYSVVGGMITASASSSVGGETYCTSNSSTNLFCFFYGSSNKHASCLLVRHVSGTINMNTTIINNKYYQVLILQIIHYCCTWLKQITRVVVVLTLNLI